MILGKSPTGNTILHVLEQYKILPKYRGHDALVAAATTLPLKSYNDSTQNMLKNFSMYQYS